MLTNLIVVYTRLTYVKPYQNIFERLWSNLKLWRIRLTDQSYLHIMLKASSRDHPYSIQKYRHFAKSKTISVTFLFTKIHTLYITQFFRENFQIGIYIYIYKPWEPLPKYRHTLASTIAASNSSSSSSPWIYYYGDVRSGRSRHPS